MKELKVTVPSATPPALRWTRWIALAYAVVAVVSTLIAVAQDLFSNAVTVALPVAQFFPRLNPTLDISGPTAKMVGGGYDHASFLLQGLDAGPRIALATGSLLQGATAVIVAWAVALVCRQVGEGAPFAEPLERAIRRSAIAILVGGLLWQVAFQLGQHLAFAQAFVVVGASWSDNAKGITPYSSSWPRDGNVSIDFWPIGIGLALFAIAAVFRYGAKVERERAALRREVQGLV